MMKLTPIISRAATGDGYAITWCQPPNLAAGNAQFFDADPRRLVQLRPLLKVEVSINGAGREANALLVVRGGQGKTDLAYYVRVPPHLRKNTRSGVRPRFISRRLAAWRPKRAVVRAHSSVLQSGRRRAQSPAMRVMKRGLMRAIQCVRRFNSGLADDICKSAALSTWPTS